MDRPSAKPAAKLTASHSQADLQHSITMSIHGPRAARTSTSSNVMRTAFAAPSVVPVTDTAVGTVTATATATATAAAATAAAATAATATVLDAMVTTLTSQGSLICISAHARAYKARPKNETLTDSASFYNCTPVPDRSL